ncbi:MAG: citrate lyase acyl carrier protein [Sporomusaceae bacterium]|nr:citrate lyase acyl carrier protein [Sporomusaceae bacterium]
MQKLQPAQAGTLESNDIQITLSPAAAGSGIQIELTSAVLLQFGDQIKAVLLAVAQEQNVTDILVQAHDRGALDCTIRARMLAVLARAGVTIKEAMA